jgi:hypothetical protein
VSVDPATQDRLYHEADARFWAQTGYQPGKRLDPHNALDAKMIPAWQSIYAEVLRLYEAGILAWTYNDPTMIGMINDAAAHSAGVVGALDVAHSASPAAPVHADALKTAGAHHDAAQAITKAAGSQLPKSALHPPVVAAAHRAAADVAANPPPIASVADVGKAMQIASAPQHAADVLAAQGLTFDAGGWPVFNAPGSTQAAPAASAERGSRHEAALPHGPTWLTPAVALGGVAAALGVGAMISSAASSSSGGRRRARR